VRTVGIQEPGETVMARLRQRIDKCATVQQERADLMAGEMVDLHTHQADLRHQASQRRYATLRCWPRHFGFVVERANRLRNRWFHRFSSSLLPDVVSRVCRCCRATASRALPWWRPKARRIAVSRNSA